MQLILGLSQILNNQTIYGLYIMRKAHATYKKYKRLIDQGKITLEDNLYS